MHLDAYLLDTLATEAQLNLIPEYGGMIRANKSDDDLEGHADGTDEQAEHAEEGEDAEVETAMQQSMPDEDAQEVDV